MDGGGGDLGGGQGSFGTGTVQQDGELLLAEDLRCKNM